jgi:alkaline phosphatase D
VRLTRRRFLARSGAAGAALVLAPDALAAPKLLRGGKFSSGVISGDPTPHGITLWTRVGDVGGTGGVRLEVARDRGFRHVVARRTLTARAGSDHTVKARIGGLKPHERYYYRFETRSEDSPVGRFQTALPKDSRETVRFAFFSCQEYSFGYFNAHEALAREDVDFVVNLGDYIYADVALGAPIGVRDPKFVLSSGFSAVTKDEYRDRYKTYRSDASLRKMHARFPMISTWDDHEVQNDYAADQSERFDPPAAFRRRRAAAYRAYWEHLPLRRRSRPRGPAARLYRRLRFGDLVELAILDTRQYRHDQPCDGNGVGSGQVVAGCRERLDPGRTLLGTEQRRWLLAGLDRSRARWNVVAQQLLMAELDLQPGPGLAYGSDGWDGYAGDRARILRFLQARRPSNPVVLGGDLHSFWVNDLTLDNHQPGAAVLASEFVGTSVSSSGPPYEQYSAYLADNPHVRFFESRWRGYLRCLVDHRRWMTDLRVVQTVECPAAPVRTLASFVVQDGRPGPQRA